MQELVPIASGFLIGLISLYFANICLRTTVVTALSIASAILVGATNGELAVSWWFAAFDAILIAGCAAIIIALVRFILAVWANN